MTKPSLKILTGVIVLFVYIFIGVPFEFENPFIESISKVFLFTLVFFFQYLLSNKSVNSVLQKVGADDVLHVVDLKNIPTTEKATFMNDDIQSAGSPTGIVFINN